LKKEHQKLEIQDYISSGAIESYVLGLASPQEMQELETLAAQYPVVKKALHDFEESLEKNAVANAVPPPSFLQAKVIAALENEGMEKPLPSIAGEKTTASATQPQPAKVVPITYAPKGVKWLRGAIAASIILLIGSSIINFYFYSKYREFNNKYVALLAENTTLTAKAKVIEASYKMVKSPDMKAVPMNAVPNKPKDALATVYWDTHSKDVWLMVNNLPQTPADKQYQLWAIVDGKPVDAGMVDMSQECMIKMKNMPNAQAFAITLEKKGGSPTPTTDQMYVVGKT
jgi:anti-sigma-K factor RskA